jgi:hypothetical protein
MVLFSADPAQLLATCQIEVCDTDRRRSARVRRRIPVPHWLYVTRASFDKLLKSLTEPVATPAPSNTRGRRTRPATGVYAEHWKQFEARHRTNPRREDDTNWAKSNGYTVKYVLDVLRKDYVAALPDGKKPADGPRKPRSPVPADSAKAWRR